MLRRSCSLCTFSWRCGAGSVGQDEFIERREIKMTEQADKFLSKEELLLRWCRQKKIFSKAEVISYGAKNYYLRAERTIRDFVSQDIVRRISKEECVRRNLKGNMAWYEAVSF